MIHFRTVFGDLAAQTHLPVVVEGYPMVDVVTDSTTISRIDKIRQSREVDAAAVQALAHAFDYEAELTPEVILLRKRFTKAEDIPDVSFEECVSVLQKLDKAVRRFYPEPPDRTDPKGAVLRFIGLFSPAQIAQLGEGFTDDTLRLSRGGMTVKSLTPEAKSLLRSMVFARSRQNSSPTLRECVALLQNIKRKNATAGWFDVQAGSRKYHLYGLELARRQGIPSFQYPLDTHFRFDFNGSIDIPSVIPDETVEARTERSEEKESHTGKMTLSSLLKSINQGGSTRYTADEIYAQKPLCLFSEGSVNPDVQFRLAAKLFHLRTLKLPNNAARLTGPRIPAFSSPEHYSALVESLMPAPLRRYLESRQSAPAPTDKPVDERLERLEQMLSKDRPQQQRDRVQERLAAKAAAELRTNLIQTLRSSLSIGRQPVTVKRPFSELSSSQQGMIGLLCFSQCLAAIEKMRQPPPRFVSQFEEGKVHFRSLEFQGKPAYFLDMSVVDPVTHRNSGVPLMVPK